MRIVLVEMHDLFLTTVTMKWTFSEFGKNRTKPYDFEGILRQEIVLSYEWGYE